MYQFSMGKFSWWEFMLLNNFLNLHVCSFDVLTSWRDHQILFWLMFRLSQVFVTFKRNFIEFMFDV